MVRKEFEQIIPNCCQFSEKQNYLIETLHISKINKNDAKELVPWYLIGRNPFLTHELLSDSNFSHQTHYQTSLAPWSIQTDHFLTLRPFKSGCPMWRWDMELFCCMALPGVHDSFMWRPCIPLHPSLSPFAAACVSSSWAFVARLPKFGQKVHSLLSYLRTDGN